MPSLEFDDFMRSVQRGEIAPAYYLHGDQDVLKNEALQLALDRALDPSTRDFNLDRRRAAELSAEEFRSLALTPPMMAPRRAVVVSEAEDLQQRRAKTQQLRTAVLEYLARPLPETLLVLVQSAGETADPELVRRASAVECKALEPARVRKWIQHRATQQSLTLDDDAVRHLYDVAGDDLAQLGAELAKLKGAVGDRAATVADVADLVGIRRGETVHEFVDAVTGRRFADAAGMVSHLLNAPGQSGVMLVISLGTALAGVALARAQLDARRRAVAADLKETFFQVRPFGVRDYKERADRWAADAQGWTMADLDAAFAALLKADKRLKSTAAAGEGDILVELLLGMAAVGVA